MEGKVLQEILRKKGITQNQVADLLGVTKQTVSAMMRTASVKSTTLEKIAENFGIEISEFFGGSGDVSELREQIGFQKKEIEALKAKLQEKDKTIDRLIGIIENKI